MRDRARECARDIADVDRRELRAGARERQHRRHAQQVREAVEEAVAGTEDHRWAKDRRGETRGFHARFGLAARAQIMTLAFAGAQRAHLQQTRHARRVAGGNQCFGEFDMRFAKAAAVAAALIEDADEVDHRLRAVQVTPQHIAVVDIGAHDGHTRQHAELAMFLAIAREHGDRVSVRLQARDDDGCRRSRCRRGSRCVEASWRCARLRGKTAVARSRHCAAAPVACEEGGVCAGSVGQTTPLRGVASVGGA